MITFYREWYRLHKDLSNVCKFMRFNDLHVHFWLLFAITCQKWSLKKKIAVLLNTSRKSPFLFYNYQKIKSILTRKCKQMSMFNKHIVDTHNPRYKRTVPAPTQKSCALLTMCSHWIEMITIYFHLLPINQRRT